MLVVGMGGVSEVHMHLSVYFDLKVNCLAAAILLSIIAELATDCAHACTDCL